MSEETKPAEGQPAQHKGRGGARPGAGRKAKWGEKTVVMRVPVSMRDAVEEFLTAHAPGEKPADAAQAADGAGRGGDAQPVGQTEQAVAKALAAATAAWEKERSAAAAAWEGKRSGLAAAWEGERSALEAQLEELHAQLVLSESERQALLAEVERSRQAAEASRATNLQGSPASAESAASGSISALPGSLVPGADASTVPAGMPAQAADQVPAEPKPKKPRAPRKKKAQDKAGAVDPSRQISLFDLLGDDD